MNKNVAMYYQNLEKCPKGKQKSEMEIAKKEPLSNLKKK